MFIQHYSYSIAPGAIQDVHAWNRFLTILDNTAANNIDVSLGDQPFTTFKKGIAYEIPEGVDVIRIKNTAGTTTTIEFYLSEEKVHDNRVSITDDLNVIDVANSIETPVAITLNAGNSYKETLAADADQKGVEIQNTGANDCWYGKQDADVDPATSRGIKLEVGADKILPINCALFFESNSVDCTISIMRLKKV
jgi:hypothetical protein